MPDTTSPRLRGNLSLVMSCLALVVALSGTAYAAGLAPGSVDTKELAKGAVTAKKIKAKAVTSPKIRPGAVGAAAVADGSIGSAELADGSIGSTDLADGSVGAADLAENSVTAAEIADGSVDAAEIADNSVTAAEIAAGAVGASEIEDGSVGAAELADASVGTGEIADRSIRLHDLGGEQSAGVGNVVNQTATLGSAVSIVAGDCVNLSLRLFNPTPPGILGSMVVGTITSSSGGPVVNNLGAVLPTLATATTQGGTLLHLTVCAGTSAQTLPMNSIVTWSLIAP